MIRFFGGVYFTFILIGLTALFVVVGTALESYSSSHLFAAEFTYNSPIFALLLWDFSQYILFPLS